MRWGLLLAALMLIGCGPSGAQLRAKASADKAPAADRAAAEKAAATKAAAEAKVRARECLSFDECELVCPDGGTMKTEASELGMAKYCERDGKRHGPWTTWYDENGQVAVKITWKNGKLYGPVTMWHKNGQVWMKFIHKDGKEHGPITAWHENGQVKMKGTFENGKEHGPAAEWNENGKVTYKGTWKNGKLVKCHKGKCPTR